MSTESIVVLFSSELVQEGEITFIFRFRVRAARGNRHPPARRGVCQGEGQGIIITRSASREGIKYHYHHPRNELQEGSVGSAPVKGSMEARQ